MKKVIVFQNSLRTTYLFRRAYIKKLIDSGLSVLVVAPVDCLSSKNKLLEMGVMVTDLPDVKGIIGFASLSFQFLKSIFNNRDSNSVFVCHFVTTFILIFPWIFVFGRNRTVVSIEGLGSAILKNQFLKKMLRFLLSFDFLIVTFCNHDEKLLLGQPHSLVIGGIGIDFQVYEKTPKNKDNSSLSLLYVGRLIKDKGVLDAIDVLRQLLTKGYDVSLTLVGEIYKNNPSSLNESQIRDIKAEFNEKVHFVGFTYDVKRWYSASDLLLLPSKREGFPVCVMEANAIGVPAICYDVPGCSDAIHQGFNGYLAEPFLIESMVSKILPLFDRSELDRLSASSAKYALENFDAEKKSTIFCSLILSKF